MGTRVIPKSVCEDAFCPDKEHSGFVMCMSGKKDRKRDLIKIYGFTFCLQWPELKIYFYFCKKFN